MASPRTVALLMAAGKGLRSGGEDPKQFRTIAGRPMIAHAYAALAGHPAIDEVVVICAQEQRASVIGALGSGTRMVSGGVLRRDSVRNGLEALAADAPARVLVHDAARPFLSADVIDRLLAGLDAHDGAVPALPLTDTLVRWDEVMGDIVDRRSLYRVQTPQAFVYEAVLAAHRAWPADQDATDDAQMVRATGHDVAIVAGAVMLEKVTHPEDFAAAEARWSASRETRVATGFDVHRLEAGEELWLGGVLIPHDKGLSGHSDADVALHAITDALLGAIADGDIGTHFPPSDPQWRGASSDRFLRHAAGLIAAQGGAVDFVDLTLICEAPKIGPYRDAIRTRIAALLELSAHRVSVKATTTERLGFAGRGEGIAAQAIATVTPAEGATMTAHAFRVAALALGLAAATSAEAQPVGVCVTGDEAEGLVLALAPDLIEAAGQICATSLPAASFVRQPPADFAARYRAAADHAWGKAREALVKIAGPDAAGIITSDYARPLLTALIVPSLTKSLKPKDCPAIDRILGAVAPLPPRNTARLVVMFLQLGNADKAAKGQKPELPLCPMDTRP